MVNGALIDDRFLRMMIIVRAVLSWGICQTPVFAVHGRCPCHEVVCGSRTNPMQNQHIAAMFNEVADLLEKFENSELDPHDMKDTLILMPSSELSRARGGFHCMSMPLLRDELE